MEKISLFENALPAALFERLVHAVEAVGMERIEGMGTYDTTFWVPFPFEATNVVEECIGKLWDLVQPGPSCIGMEWWLGRLKYGKSLNFHTDRDRSLQKKTGQIVHPLWASILYLNRFPSSPTVILDQVLSPDGKSWIPPKADSGRSLDAVPNHYVVFRGDLRHGVVASGATAEKASEIEQTEKPPALRLTLLVNYWKRRPAPPNCRDYDGTIYPSIRHEPASVPQSLSAA